MGGLRPPWALGENHGLLRSRMGGGGAMVWFPPWRLRLLSKVPFFEDLGPARWLCSKASLPGLAGSVHLCSREVSIPASDGLARFEPGRGAEGSFGDGTSSRCCAGCPGDGDDGDVIVVIDG